MKFNNFFVLIEIFFDKINGNGEVKFMKNGIFKGNIKENKLEEGEFENDFIKYKG